MNKYLIHKPGNTLKTVNIPENREQKKISQLVNYNDYIGYKQLIKI